MFPGLGHYPRRRPRQDQIHSPHSGQHVVNETLMARYIHNPGPPSPGKVKGGKTQLNGNAPLLFFLEAVGVPARQGFDQGRLPVVNMAGSTNNNVFQAPPPFSTIVEAYRLSSAWVRYK